MVGQVLNQHQGNTLEKKHHHDVYLHISFGSAEAAFCVNYTLVHLYTRAAQLCVKKQRQRISNHHCVYMFNAASLCEKG